MNAADTRFFEIVKHYASVLRSHLQWVSCHVIGNGRDGITYRERSGRKDDIEYATPSRTMPADQVIVAGRSIEESKGNH